MAIVAKVRRALGQQIGESVVDHLGLLNQLLPKASDRAWRCICFIDCYGDARFNNLQLPDLYEELARLEGRSDRPEWRALLQEIKDLVILAQHNPNYFVEFIGD